MSELYVHRVCVPLGPRQLVGMAAIQMYGVVKAPFRITNCLGSAGKRGENVPSTGSEFLSL